VPLTHAARRSALHASNLATAGQFTARAALWTDKLVTVAAQTEGFDDVLAESVSGLDHIVALFCLRLLGQGQIRRSHLFGGVHEHAAVRVADFALILLRARRPVRARAAPQIERVPSKGMARMSSR